MKVFVISDAYPLADGQPWQRQAAALRDFLDRRMELSWTTIDAYGVQWPDRFRLDGDVRAMPFALPSACGVANASLPGAPRRFGSPESTSRRFWRDLAAPAALRAGWLSPGRVERIIRRLREFAPELVILDGAILSDLAGDLRRLAPKLVIRTSGEAALSANLASTEPEVKRSIWRKLWSTHLKEAVKRNASLVDAVWSLDPEISPYASATHQIELPPLGPAPLPPTVAEGRSVLICDSTDRAVREMDRLFEGQGLDSYEIILLGGPAGVQAQRAHIRVAAGWPELNMNLAQARALYLPAPDAFNSGAILQALASGVPVVCPASTQRLFGLSASSGVIGVDTGPQAAIALARLLDDDVQAHGGDLAAQAMQRRAAAESAYTAALENVLGGSLEVAEPAGPRARRSSPFNGTPEVLFTEPTGMLMVRVNLRSVALVTEVRLLDSDRRELCSFLPNAGDPRLKQRVVEGGGIVSRKDMAGGVWVEFYSAADLVGEHFAARGDISCVACEVAALDLSSQSQFAGTLWIRQEDFPEGARLFLDDGAAMLPLGGVQKRPIPDLGLHSVSFRVPLDYAASVGKPLQFAVATGKSEPVALAQRPFRVSRMMTHQKEERGAIVALKDIHRGKRAWVIGNGPSVRLEDLNKIPEGDIVFAFNRFYLAHPDTKLRENYLFSSDTLMIKDFGQEMIDRSTGLVFFSQSGKDLGLLSTIEGRFIYLTPSDNAQPFFSYRVSDFISPGGSSVFMAIQIAHYMGIRDINLYGLDYSFSLQHVHDPRYRFPVSFNEGNHFIPNYRADRPWCPPTWRDISAGFLNARISVEAAGGRIRNATRGGKLETFERVAFEEALTSYRKEPEVMFPPGEPELETSVMPEPETSERPSEPAARQQRRMRR